MKRNTYHLSAALALLLGLAACTQDELSSPSGGVEGAPIVFTATGLNPAATAAGTRAPVDGNWEGVQSVAVMIDGTVKAYDVTPTTADNTSATLTSTDPHYWADHNDLRVTAWWPYTAGETAMPVVKVRQDQSTQDGYEGSDFIAAEEQTVSYGNPTLRFTHRTARVTVALTDRPEESMNVRLTGLSTENENPAVITPYNQGGDTWSALVAPQKVAQGTAFITCTFTSGKSFVYRMQKEAEWKAGEEYTYTVSLAAAEDPGYTIESDGNYTVNNEKGLKNLAELVNNGATDINITLDTDLTLTGEWTPIGTYDNPYTGTFDGNGKTITGLTVTGSNDYTGLFGRIGEDGTVKNVKLTDVEVTGGNIVGGVAGQNDGTVENCSVDGTVTGTGLTDTGGIVGINYGKISGCKAEGTVTGSVNVGGIAGNGAPNYDTGTGNLIGSTIEGCYSTAAVSGSSFVGGVVGNLGMNSSLMACYSTGNVTATITSGEANAGGVVGANTQGTVTGCYHAKGTVSGQADNVGGIVGVNSNSGQTTACYWSSNPANGIGKMDSGTNGTIKVDGTNVKWEDTIDPMNAALSGSGWQYEIGDEGLPVFN